MKLNKTHPYTLLQYLSKFSFLIIIPVLQQIIINPKKLWEIISSLGINIITIFLILFFSINKYNSIKYKNLDSHLYFSKGFIVKSISIIPYKNIHSISSTQTMIPYFFGSINLKLYTPSKNELNADINLNLSKKKLNSIINNIASKSKSKSIYYADNFKILLMSAFWSNSATGLLILAPFINKLGYIIGDEAQQRLYSTVNLSLQLVAIGIPPLAAITAYLLLIGWFISLIVQFFRYSGFKVNILNNNYILITRGIINNYKRILSVKNINAISTKQGLLMKIFKIQNLYINAIGNHKEKGNKNLLIAFENKNNFNNILTKIFDNKFSEKNLKNQIKPEKNALMSFILFPLITLNISVISFIIFFLKKYINDIILLIFIFIIPLIFWWLLFKIFAYKTSGINLFTTFLEINGYKRFSLISSKVSINKIQSIKITQNFIQQLYNRAHVKIYIYSKQKYFLKVKILNKYNVENFVEKVEKLLILNILK